jgi:hypothetical protein
MATAVAPSIIPYSWLDGLITEGESGKIMIELGPIGFVLIYTARLLLIATAFRYAKTLRTRFHRSLATASFLYFLAQLPGAPVFDVTCGVYYWFFAGVMMLAVRLDRLGVAAQTVSPSPAQERLAAAIPSPPRPLAPAWPSPLRRS